MTRKLKTKWSFERINWQEAYLDGEHIGTLSVERPRPWTGGSSLYTFLPNERGAALGLKSKHGVPHKEAVKVDAN